MTKLIKKSVTWNDKEGVTKTTTNLYLVIENNGKEYVIQIAPKFGTKKQWHLLYNLASKED